MVNGLRDITWNAGVKHLSALIHPVCLRFFCPPRWFKVSSETLCQFTGLYDKNSKRIWENDILMAHLDESYPEDVTYETVEWNFAGWVGHETDSTDREYIGEFDTEHFKVVGNIFDNPELLQEEH